MTQNAEKHYCVFLSHCVCVRVRVSSHLLHTKYRNPHSCKSGDVGPFWLGPTSFKDSLKVKTWFKGKG